MSHCPEGLAIADILRYERYAIDYGDRKLAQQLYAELDKRADSCQACGTCLPHCPQGLNIPTKLADAHRLLSSLLGNEVAVSWRHGCQRYGRRFDFPAPCRFCGVSSVLARSSCVCTGLSG